MAYTGSRVVDVTLPFGGKGLLGLPAAADGGGVRGVVVIAHDAGSDRFNSPNSFVAKSLQRAGIVTLLMDLHTAEEIGQQPAVLDPGISDPGVSDRGISDRGVLDPAVSAQRVDQAVDWVLKYVVPKGKLPPFGLIGVGTGAAAVLHVAGHRDDVRAVVCRSGAIDAASGALAKITAPVLLVAGGNDAQIVAANQAGRRKMLCECRLELIPGASRSFIEAGALEDFVVMARTWLLRHLTLSSQDVASLGGELSLRDIASPGEALVDH